MFCTLKVFWSVSRLSQLQVDSHHPVNMISEDKDVAVEAGNISRCVHFLGVAERWRLTSACIDSQKSSFAEKLFKVKFPRLHQHFSFFSKPHHSHVLHTSSKPRTCFMSARTYTVRASARLLFARCRRLPPKFSQPCYRRCYSASPDRLSHVNNEAFSPFFLTTLSLRERDAFVGLPA